MTEQKKAPNAAGANTSSVQNHTTSQRETPLSATIFEPVEASHSNKKKVTWPWFVGGFGGLAIALVLLFLLTARSLDIVVDAVGPPDISISGIAVPIGPRYLLRAGNYDLRVKVAGYEDWQGAITVSGAESQRIDISPAPKPGWVTLESKPNDAEVMLDNMPLGNTPLPRLSLPAGSSNLTLTLPRHKPRTTTIDITGRGIEQTIAFELEPDWADILIKAQPADASLWLGDKAVGNAGATVEVMSGMHRLTVRSHGYVEETITLNVVAGVPQEIGPIKLKPSAGALSLTSEPTDAAVTVDGTFEGRTPLRIALQPNTEHSVQLSKPGYQQTKASIQLARGDSEARHFALTPRLGDLELRVHPSTSEVLVNSKIVGRGSQTLTLPAVEQQLEIREAGHASQRLKVTPREGLRQVVDIILLTQAQARKAAIKPDIVTPQGQTLLLIDPVAEPINEFTMGASRREPGRRSNEVLHTVKLERAFYIATTETTNAQFRQFLESHSSGQIENNSLNREHQPVAQISWQQAARYCNWLSEKAGLPTFYREKNGIIRGYNASSIGFRLPTEAEWSFVSRVEDNTYRKFAWGEDFPPNTAVVNVADTTAALVTGRILNGYTDNYIVAAPVASFPPNHRGLYDIGGNVSEWIHDVYAIPSANAELTADPLGAMTGDNYTVRGSSWALSRLSELRLTYRDYGAAGRDDLGFRVARYAE